MQVENNAGAEPYHIPQPEDITQREREDAMGAYLMTFAAIGAGLPIPMAGFIASLIYHATNAKKSDFVGFHSYQSLVTEFPVSVLNAILVVWAIVIFWDAARPYGDFVWPEDLTAFWVFLVFSITATLVYMIFSIIACIQARKGRFYYFFFFGRIAFLRYYGSQRKISSQEKPAIRNELPKGL